MKELEGIEALRDIKKLNKLLQDIFNIDNPTVRVYLTHSDTEFVLCGVDANRLVVDLLPISFKLSRQTANLRDIDYKLLLESPSHRENPAKELLLRIMYRLGCVSQTYRAH